MVGMLGIEPSLSAPKADVLPVYYIPKSNLDILTFSLKISKNKINPHK